MEKKICFSCYDFKECSGQGTKAVIGMGKSLIHCTNRIERKEAYAKRVRKS